MFSQCAFKFVLIWIFLVAVHHFYFNSALNFFFWAIQPQFRNTVLTKRDAIYLLMLAATEVQILLLGYRWIFRPYSSWNRQIHVHLLKDSLKVSYQSFEVYPHFLFKKKRCLPQVFMVKMPKKLQMNVVVFLSRKAGNRFHVTYWVYEKRHKEHLYSILAPKDKAIKV